MFRIRKFLGLLDPDPLVIGTDPDPSDHLSLSKNRKKNVDFYCFATSLWPFIFEKWCKCNFRKWSAKNLEDKKLFFSWHLEGLWRKKQDPDPYQNASWSPDQEAYLLLSESDRGWKSKIPAHRKQAKDVKSVWNNGYKPYERLWWLQNRTRVYLARKPYERL